MVGNALSTAMLSLQSSQLQALQATESIASDPDSIPEAVVSLNQAQLQTQIAAHVIRSLDDTTGYLLDMIA